MSRIYEALSRTGQNETERGSPSVSGGGSDILQQQNEIEGDLMDLGGVERVQCEPSTDGRTFNPGPDQHIGVERFRLLAHKLRRLRQVKPLRTLIVTSSIPREGKTLVSANLTAVLARNSRRVILVDADLRRPGAHRTLGLPSAPGLGEVLEKGLDLTKAVRRVDPLNFYLLQAGRPAGNPVELFQRPVMLSLLEKLSSAFEWVVIDTPPLSPFADAHCLASMVDGVVVVVRAGVTPTETLKQTLASLGDVRVVGMVLNACDDQEHDYYYYSYYSRKSEKGSTKEGATSPGLSGGDGQAQS